MWKSLGKVLLCGNHYIKLCGYGKHYVIFLCGKY